MTIKHAAILASLSWFTTAQGGPLKVDFSTAAGTQAGWEAIGGTGSPSGTFSGYTDLAAGDITVSLANIGFDRLYKNGTSGPADNFPETDLDAMYSDLLFRNNDAATVDVTISGLMAGTYQITTHHLNAPNTPTQFDFIITDDNGTTTIGNYAMGLGNTSSFNPTVITVLVESNGTDDIVIQMDATQLGTGGNTGGWLGFNGLEVRVPPTGFQLDFDNGSPVPPGNTQSGWEAFSETADSNNKTLRYPGYPALAAGDITITTSGVEFTRNYNNGGSAAPDFPGTDLDRVYNDMILVNNVNDTFDISIGGLNAGTYQITTHHLTEGISFPSGKSKFDLLVTDADSPAFSQDEGNFTMGAGDGTTFASPTVATFSVTSNGTDPVVLRFVMTEEAAGGGQGAWVGLNGLEVVPGPSVVLWNFTYNSTTGSAEVSIAGAANTNYKLIEADDLDFSNPDQNPIPLTGATVGTLDGDEVTTDGSGNATVQFNLGTAKDATFLRAESVP